MDSANKKMYGFLLLILVLSGASFAAIVVLQNQANHETGPAVLIVGNTERNVTLSEMLRMTIITREGAYQNRLGNIGGNGTYRGVRVSDLVDLVGGMETQDTLTVESEDGYSQTFEYAKVYSNETFYAIQGDMVLAFEFEGKRVPDYVDGYRIMFLPEDGLYSNADANATSDPDPPGAGPQCVSNVVRIAVNQESVQLGMTSQIASPYTSGLRTTFFFVQIRHSLRRNLS